MATRNSKGGSDEKEISSSNIAAASPGLESSEELSLQASAESRGAGAGLSSVPGGKSRQFSDTVKEGWNSGKERATELARSAQDYALGWYDTARDLAVSAGDSTSVVVRRYPLMSVAAGFSVGCLLGVLLKRRR